LTAAAGQPARVLFVVLVAVTVVGPPTSAWCPSCG